MSMAKGGARTRSGPAPDPNALQRERDGNDWLILSPDGRSGRAPVWPLPTSSTPTELALWRKLWRTPQSLEWERQQMFVEVALYVRRLVEAEKPDTATALSTLVRQMGDSLGLTMVGMRANRWRVEPLEEQAETATTSRRSARERFTVVNGGA